MKKRKFYALLMSFLMVLFLVACTPSGEIDVDLLLEAAQEQITLAANTQSNLDLPTLVDVEGESVEVSWTSSHPSVISTLGVVSRPSFETGDVTVTLTATFTYEDETQTKDFIVVVTALPAPSFTVTFNSNLGTAVNNQTVVFGQKASEPTEPTRENFNFMGWYKEATFMTLFDFDVDLVTSNVTLYARWEAKPQYTVTFYTYNETNQEVEVNVVSGMLVEALSAPTKLGYTFTRWENEAGDAFDFAVPITSDTNILAAYSLNTYTITYVYPMDATIQSVGTLSYTIEMTSIDLTQLSIEFGSFIGWFDAAEDGNQVFSLMASAATDVTLYAYFEMDPQYTVTFEPNHGGDAFEQVLYYGYLAAPPMPTRPGYVFRGWYLDLEDDEAFDFAETLIESDLELQGAWDVVTYNITYHLKEGIVMDENVETYTIETPTFTLNPASKIHYQFVGWYPSLDGLSNPMTEIEQGTIGHLTLYAAFSPTSYTITYHLDGGIETDELFTTYTFDQSTFQLAPLEKEGYYFEGWFDDEAEGMRYTEIVNNSYGNLVLFARFYPLIEVFYLDDVELEAIDFFEIDFEGNVTMYAIDSDYNFYVKGSNQLGFLGYGQHIDESPVWIRITDHIGLDATETITDYLIVAPTIYLITSLNRIITWGFQGFDEEEPVIFFEPTDITALFNLGAADIKEVTHLFYSFALITTDDRLLVYDGIVSDQTPVLGPNETLSFSLVFGADGFNFSNVLFTGERIFIHLFGVGSMFEDVTAHFNFTEDIEIYAVMSQQNGIHVITDEKYYFMMLDYDEADQLEYMTLSVDLTFELNVGEFVLSTIAGGGIVTTSYRILLPVYIIEDEESEMPLEIIYYDVTNALDLEVGETIVAYFSPLFIVTSHHRLLILLPDETFTTDVNLMPEFDLITVDLSLYFSNLDLVEIRFNSFDVVVVSTQQAYQFYSEDGITMILKPVLFEARGIIHTGLDPVHMLQERFEPQAKMYQAFAGWYIDQALTTLADASNVFDGIFLYAKWIDTHFKITFEMGWDYEGIPYLPVYGELGSIPEMSDDLERDHMVFVEWYYFDEDWNYYTYDFTEPLHQNLKLYPSFQLANYDITLIYDNEDFEEYHLTTWAYNELQYISLQVPEGYEVGGVYFDEAMTLEVPMDYEILEDQIFYVKLQALTYEVFYYEDHQALSFETYYTFNDMNYAISYDGSIYGWGTNYGGALGIGNDAMYFIEHPFDMTDLFGFSPGEEVVHMALSHSAMILYTSMDRIFMWGFYLEDDEFQMTPFDMTSVIGYHNYLDVSYVFSDYHKVYILKTSGDVHVIRFSDMHLRTFNVSEPLNHVLYVDYYGFNETLLVVTTQDIFEIDFNDLDQTTDVLSHSSMLAGSHVIDVLYNYFDYQGELIVLEDGRMIKIDKYAADLTTYDPINIQTMLETILWVKADFNGYLVYTTEGIYYLYDGTQTHVIDDSTLNVGEEIVAFNFVYNLYLTNHGRSVYLNPYEHEFEIIGQLFAYDGTYTYIDLLYINYTLYALGSDNLYIAQGINRDEVVFEVGINLVIEEVTFGSTYDLREPESRPGYTFMGWKTSLDAYEVVTEAPTTYQILYAVWVLDI